MHSNLCTLFEGDYHLGVAALVNSLVRNGFEGDIWAGYRGSLPPWAASLKRIEENSYQVIDSVKIHFLALEPRVHFANYKPQFMLSLLEKTDAKALWYCDPDITIRCRWSFFVEWVRYGVTLCQEIANGSMPRNHPLRLMWVDIASQYGLGTPGEFDQYFNSGFVGLQAENIDFLQLWSLLLDAATSVGVDLSNSAVGGKSSIATDDRSYPFSHWCDQDTLNMAVMYTKCPLSTIGPEGMGFARGGFTMYHAVGSPKPWKKRMIRAALNGLPPSDADKHFVENLAGPIYPYTDAELKAIRLTSKIGAAIGRFYHRN